MAETTSKVVGLLNRPEYHQAVSVLQSLHKGQRSSLRAPVCQPMMEFQWTHWLTQSKKEVGGEAWGYEEPVAVFVGGHLLLGGLAELLRWAAESFGYRDSLSLTDYQTKATQAYNDHISNPERDYVFMDVCVEGDLIGRLVMELDTNLCPRTACNFLSLCTGERSEGVRESNSEEEKAPRMSYVNSLIHRVVPGGWIQGGDICGGKGSGGTSIYEKVFEDECYAVSHSSPGVLGMANHGRNTNSSQFYITLAPAPCTGEMVAVRVFHSWSGGC
ncbi:Probable inactive peptidyl-prolyl cis-trans isomerase-like 6 [Geodia barretti]|uniref:Peptidyl-prolyl cis-trans isomerase n=1 Tax=Geodia barretti TaxID=519541 RepID=A0AA35X4P3_GEOBA|nr:Probable inactive peptidyl-prolyl cis-trans isomerase-like 6 [Geodia barretti]